MSKHIRLSPTIDKIYAKKVSALRSALIAGEKSVRRLLSISKNSSNASAGKAPAIDPSTVRERPLADQDED